MNNQRKTVLRHNLIINYRKLYYKTHHIQDAKVSIRNVTMSTSAELTEPMIQIKILSVRPSFGRSWGYNNLKITVIKIYELLTIKI